MSTGGTIQTAEAIQIVKVNEEAHTFRLSEDDLTSIILQDNIRNRDVVIVSVAGAFRKGKSFLLDFFLRYLYARVSVQIVYLSNFSFNSFAFRFSVRPSKCRQQLVGQGRRTAQRFLVARRIGSGHNRHPHVVRYLPARLC